MTKRLLRSVMIGFCVFIAAIIIAYVTFTSAYKISAQRTTEALTAASKPAAAHTDEPLRTEDITHVSSYLARYDGTNLAIFACTDGNEEFLYTLDVCIEDISPSELSRLKDGIELSDKQALASFEEDFTS